MQVYLHMLLLQTRPMTNLEPGHELAQQITSQTTKLDMWQWDVDLCLARVVSIRVCLDMWMFLLYLAAHAEDPEGYRDFHGVSSAPGMFQAVLPQFARSKVGFA
jgi:hypothetical protein